MQLTKVDWLVIAACFMLSLAIGLYYTRRAGRSVVEYFLPDRSLPCWLVGTSVVATTFAADTLLAVTGVMARNGVAGNWLWWNFVLFGQQLRAVIYVSTGLQAGAIASWILAHGGWRAFAEENPPFKAGRLVPSGTFKSN